VDHLAGASRHEDSAVRQPGRHGASKPWDAERHERHLARLEGIGEGPTDLGPGPTGCVETERPRGFARHPLVLRDPHPTDEDGTPIVERDERADLNGQPIVAGRRDVLPPDVIRTALDDHIAEWLDHARWRRRAAEIERARKLL
jgi:hypothetical protein